MIATESRSSVTQATLTCRPPSAAISTYEALLLHEQRHARWWNHICATNTIRYTAQFTTLRRGSSRALEEAEGSVSRAAKMLGLEHQSLIHLLNTRHRQFAGKRTPATKRHRSIIKKSDKVSRRLRG